MRDHDSIRSNEKGLEAFYTRSPVPFLIHTVLRLALWYHSTPVRARMTV